jgi:hypothetical protein
MRFRVTRRNPMMSLWLSGAHSAAGKVLGPARGLMTAAARQRQKAMQRDAEKMAAAFWASALAPLNPPRRRKRKS